MKRGLAALLATTGCTLSAPALDYTGLPCDPVNDPCGAGWSCPAGICVPDGSTIGGSGTGARRTGTSGTGGSSGAGTSGSTGSAGSSGASGGNGGSTGATGGSGGATTGGGTSGGSSSAGAGSTTGPPIAVAPPVIASGYLHSCSVDGSGTVWCWGNDLWGQLGLGTPTATFSPEPVVGLPAAAALSGGNAHSCATSLTGALYCWGGNNNGELGNGGNDPIDATPVQAQGLAGVVSSACGVAHTCAVANGGAVYCWGYNGVGELGTNDTNSSSIPVQVTGLLSGGVAVTAGDFHSCALETGGSVLCWGSNSNGQLGDGTLVERNAPVTVAKLAPAVAIAAGSAHSCALTTAGTVYCWGKNDHDQLGNPQVTNTQSKVPVQVTGLGGVVALTAQTNHSCALTASGQVWCWGDNAYGQLGSGATGAESATPTAVPNLPDGVVAITTGQYHACVQTDAGVVACWGYGGYGELGDGTALNSTQPELVAFAADAGGDAGSGADAGAGTAFVASLSAGWDETLLLTPDGGVLAWGNDLYGQLGNDSMQTSLFPDSGVALGEAALAICAGNEHACAVLGDGSVACWGDNAQGQLGDGTTASSPVPVAVVGLAGAATAVACGGQHSCAIAGGDAYCWGDNSDGELGDATTNGSSVAVAVFGLGPATQIFNAALVTCAIETGGGVSCWGGAQAGGFGLLGNATTLQSNVPLAVTSLGAGVTQVAVATTVNGGLEGIGHACAVSDGGELSCWGTGVFGELGNGQTGPAVYEATPTPVMGLPAPVTSVAVGGNHTCALTVDGAVLCWGRGEFGSLGNGSTTDESVPTAVPGLGSGVVAIAAGEMHSCALTATALYCWGSGGDGELGDGSLGNALSPVAVLPPGG
ncbi:MAG TPA: RCC1 repeat-containing protein [Myxococcales bacterium]|nr:RCC1 repeat-containing protein [Myxococcales bacterium]